MYTLYWEKMSGAIGPQVLLDEIGANYDRIHVDMAAGAHRNREYRSINPVARVPALKLPDGEVVGETAAITIVLGERHPDSRLVPAATDTDRSRFLFWLMVMATSGYPVFSRAWHPEQFTSDDSANETVRQTAEQQLQEFFSTIENAIEGEPYFLRRGFTALDIYLTMLTEWASDKSELFASNPRLSDLCASVGDRPSYSRVIRQHLSGEDACGNPQEG
ncbi:glutathione S-transferase family protein [Hoeflea sp. WL0058]|uniref:Glutathione S-transferase family protein n=1 Tax=Flavimaribacter sediminis TaxID=2865987 RepID=A0AAE2ZR92_9HYPH|nr:glutathione S-transferase family protein [Flavimaribacter sediminis]MBW8640661.1 glutathione S-transferase family protein [Flavimaribacter sediminis]